MNGYYGAREFSDARKKRRSNEPFRFSINENSIDSFLEKRGLKTVSHFDDKEIEKAFLENKNASFLGQIAGFFRFTLASPNGDSKKIPELKSIRNE